ncbi:MAG: hypothetical protein K0S38_247 [Candidatus Paceibacter sp.]|jgi:hypothetical protein|nr:hypothetical protein [Candidatus Paceibacter sp.]
MKYTYGDTAYLKNPGGEDKVVAIVGLTPIETEELSKHFKAPIGTNFYTIEFSDGTDKLVSEDQLEPYTETKDAETN